MELSETLLCKMLGGVIQEDGYFIYDSIVLKLKIRPNKFGKDEHNYKNNTLKIAGTTACHEPAIRKVMMFSLIIIKVYCTVECNFYKLFEITFFVIPIVDGVSVVE